MIPGDFNHNALEHAKKTEFRITKNGAYGIRRKYGPIFVEILDKTSDCRLDACFIAGFNLFAIVV